MILSRRVALNGQQLDELSEEVVIQSVDPGVPHETVSAVNRMGSGQRMTTQHWDTLDISVSFGINIPKTKPILRRQIFDMVIAWALQKGWLTFNQIENRRVYVDKVTLPDSGDLRDWTSTYTIIFRAYNVPFWQDVIPVSATSPIQSGWTVTLPVTGNVETPIDVQFQNASGMLIPNFSVSAGGKTINMTGVNIDAGQTLEITHGVDGLLRANVSGRDVYGKITNYDDLLVSPGNVNVSISASRAGRATVSAFGRWL